MIENTNTTKLLAEIANEAESNDGIKSVRIKAKTILVVRYNNTFRNEWYALTKQGVDLKAVAALLRKQITK